MSSTRSVKRSAPVTPKSIANAGGDTAPKNSSRSSQKSKGSTEGISETFRLRLLEKLSEVFPVKLKLAEYTLVTKPTFTNQGLEVHLRSQYKYDAKSKAVKDAGVVHLFTSAQLVDEKRCLDALAKLTPNLLTLLKKRGSRMICTYDEFFPLVLSQSDPEQAYHIWRQAVLALHPNWLVSLREQIQKAESQFPAVEAKFQKIYGLKLPRHLCIFVGFYRALTLVFGNRLINSIAMTPAGVLDWFDPAKFERQVEPGLDERLYFRYVRDPPEMVTVATGDIDGLHWGLWYDKTDELPRVIVYNYAWCEAETISNGCVTLLDSLQKSVSADQESDAGDEQKKGYLDAYPFNFRRRLILELLEDARDRETELLAIDNLQRIPPVSMTYEQAMAKFMEDFDGAAFKKYINSPEFRAAAAWSYSAILGGMCPRLPSSSSALRERPERASELNEAYDNEALVTNWIQQAWQFLKKGDPGPACIIGHEIFWKNNSNTIEEGVKLLSAAYKKMKRPELDAILLLHHKYRNLPSVYVYKLEDNVL